MARQLRVTYDGAVYHVYNRGAGKQDTFNTDADRRSFLELLGVVYERYEAETHAYCLMSNHYHLLVRTPKGNISEAMRYLNSVYTQRFNRTHDRDGSLFRGRFGAQLVIDDDYIRQLSAYIHLNPIRAGIVARPAAYPWSSYVFYLDQLGAPGWLFDDMVLAAFGGSRQGHRRFVEQATDGTLDFDDLDLDVPVLGRAEERPDRLDETPRCRETDPSRRRAEPNISVERIARLVAIECGVSSASLRTAVRGRPNTPRDIAVSIAQTAAGLSQSELAQAFGYAHAASVSSGLNRFRINRRTHRSVDDYAQRVERSVLRGLTPLVVVDDE